MRGRQSPNSLRLRSYTRSDAKLRPVDKIDHSKRPHHDRLGRPIPPWTPEEDAPLVNEKGKKICGAVRKSDGHL